MSNPQELEILFKDDHFVAVNKPAGLLVHPSPIDRREKNFAVRILRDQIGQMVYPVHRLDRPTSGVLLFALNPEISKKTALLFQTGQVWKKYIAVVRGYVPEQGTIDHPLKEVKDRYVRRRNDLTEKTYPAVTDFKRLAAVEIPFAVDKYPTSRYSLAALFPKTGRRHQLRRHMTHISHPIIGDTRYGKDVHNKFFITQFHCKSLLLAALELAFIHPETGADMLLTATPNPDFDLIIKEFNWQI